MDFDLSKENIQPLRGGRNIQQLEMALQAQSNLESQQQLLAQREEFENLIRNYEGEDPLENYYNYIYWIEQSYPKRGHEGNYTALLEHCLSQFENDVRYRNDRRFCKLWIKYIDMFPNPTELYLMMRSKDLCTGCADFYKAWSYYYEIAGDFQKANSVFEEGKKNLAQPFEELESAHKNLITAAGEHMLYGPNQNRLQEKRQALISLEFFKSGRVNSVRVPSNNITAVLNASHHAPNAQLNIYEDQIFMPPGLSSGVAPSSIISVAKRQEAPKENKNKAGPWTTGSNKKSGSSFKQNKCGFTVFEDECDMVQRGLPSNIPATCLEDYSNWRVSLINFPEEPSPMVKHGYPKDRVYIDCHTEYSLEELRATRYKKKPEPEPIQSILIEDDNDEDDDCVLIMQEQPILPSTSTCDVPIHIHKTVDVNSELRQSLRQSFADHQTFLQDVFNKSNEQRLNSAPSAPAPAKFSILEDQEPSNKRFGLVWSPQQPLSNKSIVIYEQSFQQELPQPKGKAMKTAFRTLNTDDLVETGSRNGMDAATAAQPMDSAKPMPHMAFSDSSSSSFGDPPDLDDSCTTQQFNFNLNAMQVSTPQTKSPLLATAPNNDTARKNLFGDTCVQDKILSPIPEETKSGYCSTSSSKKISTISDEHNSYLAQNLMANAALRRSLLGIMNDLDEPPAAPSPMQSTPAQSPRRPTPVRPLSICPSDPFSATLLSRLLDRVGFPDVHADGYVAIEVTPRLVVKKEAVYIGNDRYIVEKLLGKGQFGTVFKALDCHTRFTVALKYQKPPNRWEYYICKELKARLAGHPLRDRFMDVSLGYFSDQASILVSKFEPFGSLLDAVNLLKVKGNKPKESLCVYFTLEMLKIVKAMHEVHIIHADIKPDNFLLLLQSDNTVGLQLIDFGCSIDMKHFPKGTTFTRPITTENFVCCEVRDGRPWSYHTDLFCVAASVHVLLFQEYIQVRKIDNVWSISTRLPRYAKVDLWNMFFSNLLNQQTGLADVATLEMLFEEECELHRKRDLPAQLRYLVNMLKNR